MYISKYLLLALTLSLLVACGSKDSAEMDSKENMSTESVSSENKTADESAAESAQATQEQVAKLALEQAHKILKRAGETRADDWPAVEETFLNAQKAFANGEFKKAQELAIEAQKKAEKSLFKPNSN